MCDTMRFYCLNITIRIVRNDVNQPNKPIRRQRIVLSSSINNQIWLNVLLILIYCFRNLWILFDFIKPFDVCSPSDGLIIYPKAHGLLPTHAQTHTQSCAQRTWWWLQTLWFLVCSHCAAIAHLCILFFDSYQFQLIINNWRR